MISCDKDKKSGNLESEDSVEPKGDSEMAPVYLKRMLPVFCNTFQSTMLPSIRYIKKNLFTRRCSCFCN